MTSGEGSLVGHPDGGSITLERLADCPTDHDRDELVRRSGGNEALRRLADEAEALAGRSVQRGIEWSTLLASVADRVGGASERARVRRAQALALSYGGRLADALRACEDAHRIASPTDRVEAARARLAAMQPLCLLGQVTEAIDSGRDAREALRAAGARELMARADLNLANAEKRRGDAGAALRHLEAARAQVADDAALRGIVDNARGEALLLLDEFADAEQAFIDSAATHRQIGAGFHLAMVEGNLAELLARRGRLQEALTAYETARRRFEEERAWGHAATIRIAHAEALEIVGLPGESLAGFDAASELLAPIGRRIDLGRVAIGRARALLRLRRLDEARNELRTAIAAFEEAGNVRGTRTAELLLGEVLLHAGDAVEARALLERVAGVGDDAPLLAAAAEHHLATHHAREGRMEEAVSLLERALERAERLQVPTLLADILHSRGLLRRQRGDLVGAIADLRRAIETVERVRGSLHADRLRATFLGNRVAVYQALVATLLDRGGESATEAAFGVAEQAKSRTLLEAARSGLDVAVSALRASTAATERALAEELERVQSELNALYSQLADGEPNQRRAGTAQWIGAVRTRERLLESLEQRLGSLSSAPIAVSTTCEPIHITRTLAEESALVEFFIAEGELMAWVLRGTDGPGRPERPRLFRNLARERDLAEAVGRLQFQLGRALRQFGAREPSSIESARLERDFAAAATRVHEATLGPLREVLHGIRRLVIVPHGPLHLVPWPAVRGPGGWLVQEHEIEVAPSASLWSRLAPAVELPRLREAAVVGLADAQAPAIAEEIRAVAKALGAGLVLEGPKATIERTLEALRSAPLVHIACHGRFSVDAPRSSGLRLADRWLTARDLDGIRVGAELVVLSGCETGRSLVASGDELLGLLRGFLLAGARRLVVSLWSTHDRTATELMTSTYHSLAVQSAAGMFDPALALREAQLDMLDRRPHPIHWAPFVLVGRS